MPTPSFFDDVRTLTLADPLADFLGAAEDGIVEYTYRDAVKLAGHSCPTVAGAYLATLKALERLYPDTLPQRGSIRVAFRDDITSGVTGVMANIATLLTGATQDSGFKGLAGRFDRRHLLSFNSAISGEMRFERVDGGGSVTTGYHPEIVPPQAAMKELMGLVMAGAASADEQKEFGRLWQERVKRILIDHIDDPMLLVLR
jgi:hypothetical protein